MIKSETDDLLIKIDEGIMKLTLNRPNSLNAFSPEMYKGLSSAIRQANAVSAIRVIIINGNGKSFCAGGDIKGMGEKKPIETYDHMGLLNEVILSMRDSNKVIIAAVHGHAAGAGFNLALASDIILASEETKFILSFSKVGLIPDGGGSFFLPRIIGPYRAKELLFSAEPLLVEEAHSLNIVNHIYPKDNFSEKVMDYARKITNGPPESFKFIKKLINSSFQSSLEEMLEQERITQATLATTKDHKEGIRAFKEKRQPKFGRN